MTKEYDIKSQRDRFLAFAFAGSDFLIEIDRDGKIVFTTGATKFFTGFDDQSLTKKDYRDLFAANDVPLLDSMHIQSKAGIKQGPYLVAMKNMAKVFVSGFSMLENGSLYLSVSKSDSLLRIMGFEKEKDEPQKIANAKEFENLLQKKIPDLIASGKDADVRLLDLAGINDHKGRLNEASWQEFMGSIAEVVMASSLDGDTAAEVEEGKYIILQDANKPDGSLEEKIKGVAKRYHLEDALNIQTKTIEGDLPNLTAREATRAIMYTMNKMEKSGLENCGDDLNKTFKSYLEENTNKIKNLKNIISHQRFQVHFQPIVDLKTTKVMHHEVLMRFDGVSSPYEMIVLGEDVGIAPDIDISVCKQALKYADQHQKVDIGKLAVNLSGASVQNEMFVETLISTLHEYPRAAKHIIFEITESSNIKNLDLVDGFIQRLRAEGHQICLDDFGAGAASFQYLHKLHVDGVKIDGAYTQSILKSPRDATMIKNLTQMCHELDIFVVAEMVETQEQARYLRDIGVDKGQGWLFGKAAPDVLPL